MKSTILLFLGAMVLIGCTTSPARHVSSGQFDRAFLSGAYQYLGESDDHAFLRRGDGSLIYSDTVYLEPEVVRSIRAAGKRYSGPYSNVGEH